MEFQFRVNHYMDPRMPEPDFHISALFGWIHLRKWLDLLGNENGNRYI
jgi:hypothetical protein